VNGIPNSFVVDASVGIQLFVDEPYSDIAHALFSEVAKDPPRGLYVPDLFYIECANILVKYVQRFGRSLEDSQIDLADLKLLTLRSTPTEYLTADALTLAVEKRLTAYDACYAVLAKQLGIPLITADEPMVRAIDWALWVGDYDPS
jgi:predicted nucleic acid-binding protein